MKNSMRENDNKWFCKISTKHRASNDITVYDPSHIAANIKKPLYVRNGGEGEHHRAYYMYGRGMSVKMGWNETLSFLTNNHTQFHKLLYN